MFVDELITEEINATAPSLAVSVPHRDKQAMWPNTLPKICTHEAHKKMTSITIGAE